TGSTHVRVSPFRSSRGQRRGRFSAEEYSCWRRGPLWKSACNGPQASIQAPTLTVCTTRRCSANWPGTSAMDGALATCLELISTTIARWRYHSPVAWSDTSLNQRFALSYTGNDWAATANVIWGIHQHSVTDRAQLSPCPVAVSPAVPFPGCNPNFINVDLTVGHSFGKWQVAWVGFYSSDLNAPILGYQKQSQFAMGGLLGYDFGPV